MLVLSPYRSLVGANARPRLLPHAGGGFAAPVGTPVLAVADGLISTLIDYEPGCGVGVVLSHPRFKRWTAYCHLTRAPVRTGQAVARGERVGLSGASGNSAGVPHVHLELCTTACASHRDGISAVPRIRSASRWAATTPSGPTLPTASPSPCPSSAPGERRARADEPRGATWGYFPTLNRKWQISPSCTA